MKPYELDDEKLTAIRDLMIDAELLWGVRPASIANILLAEVDRLRVRIAEFGKVETEWYVTWISEGRRAYYEGPYDSEQHARESFGPIKGDWRVVHRLVGDWHG